MLCTRGSVSVPYLTGLVLAAACVSAMGGLGDGMASAIGEDAAGAVASSPSAVAPFSRAPMATSRQAGLADVALSGTRVSKSAVRSVREFAALVPPGPVGGSR